MKNILLPTDFSDNAWNATVNAIKWHENENCVFHFLNTYTPTITNTRFLASSFSGSQIRDSARKESEKKLKKMLGRIQQSFSRPNHSFKTISSFSLLIDELKETLEKRNIDLVVTGTKGASGLKETFLGSNTVRIIKSIKNCPIVVIPQYFQFSSPSEIAFVTDYKRNFDAEVLQPLLTMALNFNATIRVMHISTEEKLDKYQESNMHILSEYLAPVNHTFHWMPNFTNKTEVVQSFLEELDIDILFIVNYQHSLLDDIRKEPVIKRLAFQTSIPIWVIPEVGIDANKRLQSLA